MYTSTGLLALLSPHPHQHRFVGPGAAAPIAPQVCWPWSHRTISTQAYCLRLQTMFSYSLADLQLSSLHKARSKGAGGSGEAFKSAAPLRVRGAF